jgi:hypothetical protein
MVAIVDPGEAVDAVAGIVRDGAVVAPRDPVAETEPPQPEARLGRRRHFPRRR